MSPEILDRIHKNNVGSVFEVTIKEVDENGDAVIVDISSFTTKSIRFEKADGTSLVVTAEFKTDGTDGILKYTTIATDLTVAGLWRLQGYVAKTGSTFYSTIDKFVVFENI